MMKTPSNQVQDINDCQKLVIRIERAEHLVDKPVTEVQGESIEFQSYSASDSASASEWEPEPVRHR